MSIVINLDVMMAKRKKGLTELAGEVDITLANLSILKNNKAKAVRLSTLNAICKALDCQPGDILQYVEDDEEDGAVKLSGQPERRWQKAESGTEYAEDGIICLRKGWALWKREWKRKRAARERQGRTAKREGALLRRFCRRMSTGFS